MKLTDAYTPHKKYVDRNNEYYPTPPIATLALLKNHPVPKRLWEPAAGRGHISKELIRNGHIVHSSDLFAYDDPLVPIETGVNFLTTEISRFDVDGIITNPPFKSNLPEKLIERVLTAPLDGWPITFLALFCRLTFMESARRYELFKKYPPSRILVFSERINCDESYFDKNHGLGGGMVAYAWYVWDYNWKAQWSPFGTDLSWIRASDYIGDLE